MLETTDEDISRQNAKYAALFERFRADLERSRAPVAVLNGIFAGFVKDFQGVSVDGPLNGPITAADFAHAARGHVGDKLRLVIVDIGDERQVEQDWGVEIRLPDQGHRQCPAKLEWAEPAHVFEDAFVHAVLTLTR